MLTSLNFRKLITKNKIIFNFVLFICMNFFINSSNQFDYTFSCVVLGETEAGKTTVIKSLLGEEYTDKYTPTVTYEYKIKRYTIDSKIVKLGFEVFSGVEKTYNALKNFISNHQIAIIILPLDKDEPLNHLKKYVQDIKEKSSNCKCIIVLNKVDLGTKNMGELNNLKIECDKILKTNSLEGEVIYFSAKFEEYVNVLNREIEKMLQELIKEKGLLIKEEELPKKDDSPIGKGLYVDSSPVKKHKQKTPVTNTKKSASNNNVNEHTNQKQNCISCRAK